MTPWRVITRRARQPRKKRRALFECGRCGKKHSNPLGHTCSGGGDFKRRAAAAQRAETSRQRRADESARRKRERGRVAAARSDERAKAARRVAAARVRERERADARVARAKGPRRAAAGRSRTAHPYQSCRDQDCARPACVAFREGVEVGVELATADPS